MVFVFNGSGPASRHTSLRLRQSGGRIVSWYRRHWLEVASVRQLRIVFSLRSFSNASCYLQPACLLRDLRGSWPIAIVNSVFLSLHELRASHASDPDATMCSRKLVEASADSEMKDILTGIERFIAASRRAPGPDLARYSHPSSQPSLWLPGRKSPVQS